MVMSVDYNKLANWYQKYRKPDPRIANKIWCHTNQAEKVLNIGAGTGAYEPESCEVVAIEPSSEMVAMRKNSSAKILHGIAENLPFRDNEFDVSMAILTIHHWSDIQIGLSEMSRVTRKKIVLLTWVGYESGFWLEDYLPEIKDIDLNLFPSLVNLESILGSISVETVDIPHDCTDGFMCAYWRRPSAYLNPEIRKAISTFSRISDTDRNLIKLQDDLESGVWKEKYGYLLQKLSLDLGYRLVIHEQ